MAEKITFADFMAKVADMKKAYAVGAMTDQYYIARLEDLKKDIASNDFNTNKFLELRVFNREREEKIFRMTVDSSGVFHYRVKKDNPDEAENSEEMFDERQFLDINTKEACEENGYKKVKGTRGGSYRLPLEKIDDAMIEIRYYLAMDKETGQARVVDWRLLSFVEGK